LNGAAGGAAVVARTRHQCRGLGSKVKPETNKARFIGFFHMPDSQNPYFSRRIVVLAGRII
jgi:hypothetical protein